VAIKLIEGPGPNDSNGKESMIQPLRLKGLESLVGNLAYSVMLVLPTWGGLALGLYGLSLYGIAPLKGLEKMRQWLGSGSASSNN
jgi:hypothetical protein